MIILEEISLFNLAGMSHKQTRTEKWALLSVVGSTMKENSNTIEGNLEKTRMVLGVDSLLSGGAQHPPQRPQD